MALLVALLAALDAVFDPEGDYSRHLPEISGIRVGDLYGRM